MGKQQSKHTKQPAEEESKPALLMIGARGSGSTTLRLQIQALGAMIPQDEINSYIPGVQMHMIRAMQSLVAACKDIEPASGANSTFDSEVAYELMDNWGSTLVALKELWKRPEIQRASSRPDLRSINNAKYFFDNLERIGAKDYVPTIEDCLNCHRVTTGFVFSESAVLKGNREMFEVGGRRRTRMYNRLEQYVPHNDKSLLVYMCSVSDFAVQSFSGENTVLGENFLSYSAFCHQSSWGQTEMVLILTKVDVFREYIRQGHSITSTFPDYTGPPDDADQSLAFIKMKFSGEKQGRAIHILEGNLLDIACVKEIVAVINETYTDPE